LPAFTGRHPARQPPPSNLIANPATTRAAAEKEAIMRRLSHILTTAALLAVTAVPASAATFEERFRTSYQPAPASQAGGQDLRSPDAVDAAAHRGIYAQKGRDVVLNRGGQDLRSPDAVDAAAHRGVYAQKGRDFVLNRDYGSPDAVDAARDLPPVQIPVVGARDVPSSGFDWGDAGIGAAGMLALFSIAAACALLLTGRKRRPGLGASTH
jgi:hypothetical protein